MAEPGLLAAERRWRMRVTIVRPALVYGGAMKGGSPRCALRKKAGCRAAAVGNTPMIALPDLVRARAVGAHPTISGNIFAERWRALPAGSHRARDAPAAGRRGGTGASPQGLFAAGAG
jgi:hypothetical protein